MSDASLPNPGNDVDDELVFDDLVFETPPMPIMETAAAKARPGRAKKMKGVAPPGVADEAPDVVALQPPTVAADAIAPAADPIAPEEDDAQPADGAAPSAPRARPHPLLIATVALALLTSLFSLGGMIAVSRILAAAQADRRTAHDAREKLDQVPALVARLSAESARLEAVSARITAATPGGPPATLPDIRHELDMLKLQIAQSQPQGMDALNGTMRQSFSELGTKIDRIGDRVGAHVSASRPGPREDDQAPPS